ncbi:hypothetical protein [Miltoncostaea marina]|uniref:hypothetical protein n=1 Tax=Miltoncostaea marina TaxID=2843215 RepID=UPI001C3E02B4|nr:hypothetical protein [Miltoncostaea marina]
MQHPRTGPVPRARAVAAAAVAAAALAAPAGGAAAPAVLPPADLSAPGATVGDAVAALDGAGAATVVWERRAGDATSVVAATRAPGGAWGAPAPLSAAGRRAGSPAVAVAPDGGAVAVWRRDDGGGRATIEAAVRPAGGAFGAPVALSAPDALGALRPRVAIAPSGAAAAAWLRFDGQHTLVEVATRPPGGAFGAPRTVSAPGADALAPAVAVDGAGRATVAWNRADGAGSVVQVARGDGAAGFTAPADASRPGATAFGAAVGVAPSGAGVLLWSEVAADGATVVVTTPLGADGGPGAPATISPEGDASTAQVAVDGAGRAIATWRLQAGGRSVVQAAERPAGGAWGAPVDLSAPGVPAADPRPALDAAGRAAITWRRADGADPRVQLAVREPGATWGAPSDVSARGAVVAGPVVALDGAGNGLVVWRRALGADDVVQAAGLDGAPPVVEELAVPAAGAAGAALTLRVRARDVWSPLDEPVWDVPSATLTGASVVHAFAAGRHRVRVRVADALGNATTAEGAVTVVAATRPQTAASAPVRRQTAVAPRARRSPLLRASLRLVRRGQRVELRVRGRAGSALAGRRLIVERRAGRAKAPRPLCRVLVRRSGAFDGRCRVERLVRGGQVLRVRVRAGSTRATRARALPWVSRRAAPAGRPADR